MATSRPTSWMLATRRRLPAEMPQFAKQSTQPLTAEGYRHAAAKLEALAQNVGTAARMAHSVNAGPRDRARLTRAIHALANASRALARRHSGE